MAANICVNQVYRDMRSDKQFRMLWKEPDPAGSFIYWLDKPSIPQRVALADLDDAIEHGWIVEDKDPFVLQKEPTEEEKQFRNAVWDKMKEALLDEPGIYDRKIRAEHLRRIEKESGEKQQNLYKRLRRYWQRGKTPDAFLPDFNARGAKGKTRIGRAISKTDQASEFGKELTLTDTEFFDTAIKKYYLTKVEPSLSSTYQKLLEDSYSTVEKLENGEERVKLLPKGEVPSLRQFRYWYNKHYDAKEVTTGRKGETGFELNGRAMTGKNDFGMRGPGSEYQVDATVADVYLVSQFNRKDIIGRPVMYFVMDVASRIVTGMYIGLEGPSWLGMTMALYNATTNKVDYCHQFGLEISEEQWPCHHVPSVLLGDRGELESHKADNLVSMLGVRVDNAPPYRGDLKPIIESHFKTINETVKPLLPGFVLPDDRKRGGKDYRLDAKLDIKQFTRIIIDCVLFYNNEHYLKSFEKNEQMLKSSVEAIPVKLWNWGIQNSSGALRIYPKETIQLALMPKENGSVTEDGIYFKKLYYTCQEARDGNWFENARKNGRYAVEISYDPRNMSEIVVWDSKDGQHYRCTLLDWEQRFSEKSLEEVEYEQKKQDYEKKQNERAEMEAHINLNRKIAAIVEEANQMAPTTVGMTKAERLSDIRENRQTEKETIRAEESFTGQKQESETKQIDQQPLPAMEEQKPGKPLTPIQKMLWEDLKQRRKGNGGN